jgi:hypothetical protein
MSDNKYMAFSMQIFLTFLLVIVGTVISTKLLMLRVLAFILTYPQILYGKSVFITISDCLKLYKSIIYPKKIKNIFIWSFK